MPQAAIKMHFLDDPTWPEQQGGPAAAVPPFECRVQRLQRIQRFGRLIIPLAFFLSMWNAFKELFSW